MMNFLDRLFNRENTASHFSHNLFLDASHKWHSLHCRDLLAHHDAVDAIEFSDDGMFFVSGGQDRRVLLWKIDDVFGSRKKPESIVMNMEHENSLFCLALSPDNDRIFSGGKERNVYIHDPITKQLMGNVPHRFTVYSIALQPESRGNIFASSCADGKLRLFDIRINSVDPVIQTASRAGALHSAMFSPKEPALVAIAGLGDGTKLHDMRLPTRCLHFYPCQEGTIEVRFNSKGTRLLCLETNRPPVLYDLPTRRHWEVDQGKMQLVMSEEHQPGPCLMDAACFAGRDDELVVAGSEDHGIYIWRIPDGPILPPLMDDEENEPFIALRGHRSIVNQVRYNGHFSTLASCSNNKEIKFWTPFTLPHSIHFKERRRNDSDASFNPDDISVDLSTSDSDWNEDNDNDSEGSTVSSISTSSNSSGDWDTDEQANEDALNLSSSSSSCSSSP